MNFFFGINSLTLQSKITIPRFQNNKSTKKKYKVFQIEIVENRWEINDYEDAVLNDDFYQIENKGISNKKIFCLATDNEVKKFENNNDKKLINLNSYTDTIPAFRANLQVSINKGGFSSYQSEYPFHMVTKKGSILSPLSSLCNKSADKNILFFKNIYELPIHDKFAVYFINLKTKRVIKKEIVLTNFLNEIIIEKDLIQPGIFLFTDKYIGIPIFCSIQNKHIAFEHTHPPHEYILDENRFKMVSKLKNEFNEIIN